MKALVRFVLPMLVIASLAVTGCSRRTTQTPPTPTPAPPAEPAPTQQPETPPAPTTPAPSTVGSGDFQPALFDFDSYALGDAARRALDANARLLRDNPTVQVTIEGHADERGTTEYNLALGERRAQAARDYLIAAGIDGSRLQTVSMGEERPFSTGSSEEAWAQNRRAHFAVR